MNENAIVWLAIAVAIAYVIHRVWGIWKSSSRGGCSCGCAGCAPHPQQKEPLAKVPDDSGH